METSIPEEGFGNPRQEALARTGSGRQRMIEEKAIAGMSNDQASTRPRSTGGNPLGGAKLQSWEQKRKGGADVLVEDGVRPGETQASVPQIKEILAEMLAKVEVSLKLDIAAFRSDIEQVLGRVEEEEERQDMYDHRLEEIKEQMKSLQRDNRSLSYKIELNVKKYVIRGLPEK